MFSSWRCNSKRINVRSECGGYIDLFIFAPPARKHTFGKISDAEKVSA
jgi:hypothetical protein